MTADDPSADAPYGPHAPLAARLEALEQRVAALETQPAVVPRAEAPDPETFWALTGLREREPGGAVVFTGHADTDHGPVEWQYGRTTAHLMGEDWSEHGPVLDALGHPARLTLLQLIAGGVDSTAELARQDTLGSTGQIHHHLRILIGAGWLVSAGRGRYRVPPTRLIPLLAILTAAERT